MGSITEAEIENIEAQVIKSQLGLKGDFQNRNVLKLLSFFPKLTASLIATNGTVIRRQIDEERRARPKRNFSEADMSAEAKAAETDRIHNQLQNRQFVAFTIDEYKLALALTRKQTVPTFGHLHYCQKHETIVDAEHIDFCDLIHGTVHCPTDVIVPLHVKASVWDLSLLQVATMKKRLASRQGRLISLTSSDTYIDVPACHPDADPLGLATR